MLAIVSRPVAGASVRIRTAPVVGVGVSVGALVGVGVAGGAVAGGAVAVDGGAVGVPGSAVGMAVPVGRAVGMRVGTSVGGLVGSRVGADVGVLVAAGADVRVARAVAVGAVVSTGVAVPTTAVGTSRVGTASVSGVRSTPGATVVAVGGAGGPGGAPIEGLVGRRTGLEASSASGGLARRVGGTGPVLMMTRRGVEVGVGVSVCVAEGLGVSVLASRCAPGMRAGAASTGGTPPGLIGGIAAAGVAVCVGA
jgi:hypothetical protein